MIPMIGMNGFNTSERLYKKNGPYMTTILVENNWKQPVKSPNYRKQGGLIMTNASKGKCVVKDGT